MPLILKHCGNAGGGLALLVLLTGCAMQVPRGPVTLGTVDFHGLFGVTLESRVVGPARAPDGLMRRVVVDPMLVEAPSRPEVGVIAGSTAIEPEVGDLLLAQLVAAGSVVVSPAALRSMLAVGCKDPHCRTGTWVEQVHWLARHAAKSAPALSDPPTVALPVTALAVEFEERPVTVVWNAAAARLEVTPQLVPSERTLCPNLSLPLPVARIGIEVFDAATGALVAKTTTRRTIETSTPAQWKIAMYQPREPQGPVAEVPSYCASLRSAWRERVMRVLAADKPGQRRTLQGLIKAAIAPLLSESTAK